MIQDKAHDSRFSLCEKEHSYGSHVHLIDDPFMQHLLARFCSASVIQPEANQLISEMYRFLIRQAANDLLPRSIQQVSSRMSATHSEARFELPLFDLSTRAVVVDLMRAGILPTLVCFETLHQIIDAQNLRQDHILLNRKTNDKGEVVGVNMSGHKIGGPIADSFVFLPDPMGATGSSILHVVELLKRVAGQQGPARRFVALHLIVTPEYLRATQSLSSEMDIFALRLDRGLSASAIFQTTPGSRWSEERGLTDRHYIVPGAGGIGEILNNSFV